MLSTGLCQRTQSCLCLRLTVNGSTGPLWSTRICSQVNGPGQSATAPDQGDPCGGGEQDGLPSYLWSVLEPTTVNSPGIRKSLWRSTWVQWLRTIAFRKNCTCRLLSRALEEWIRLGLETFAEVVVNNSIGTDSKMLFYTLVKNQFHLGKKSKSRMIGWYNSTSFQLQRWISKANNVQKGLL